MQRLEQQLVFEEGEGLLELLLFLAKENVLLLEEGLLEAPPDVELLVLDLSSVVMAIS